MSQIARGHNLPELTELVANNVMLYHDLADYDGLEGNTVGIVKELGYSDEVARRSARLVRDIYIQYDEAQRLHDQGKEIEERTHYSAAHDLANCLNLTLDSGYRTNNIVNMVFYWRHKRKALAMMAILRDWVEKLGFRNIPIAAYCTYLQIRAGYSHDKRNREEFERHVGQLWSIVALAKKGDKLPILF